MYLLGYDVGSSSVKGTLLDANDGRVVAGSYYPKTEMPMEAPRAGWAEQSPRMWWEALKKVTGTLLATNGLNKDDIKAIGISYQMHGLVVVDKNQEVLRPAIIWCDSRAVEIGDRAFEAIGKEKCLSRLLNSPGNFTASKLRWVKENEPAVYERIDQIMLPGDYIAMRLSGEVNSTISGLSEGIFWDFQQQQPADFLLQYYGIEPSLLPPLVPTFGIQSRVQAEAAAELGLPAGIPITYRAGDQPNNALSLNVLNAGEIAATAGTSGVIYGVSEEVKYDHRSRVNSFAHVNYQNDAPRLGVLLCINGTGILNAWLRRNTGNLDYGLMNELAGQVEAGSAGLCVLPFGNGAERVLNNQNIGSQINGLDFNQHHNGHLFRAAQEGIVFSLHYGLDIMGEMGIAPNVIRAGHANMFLSPIFRETLANISDTRIELYNTDGAQGAARGAGIGLGHYSFSDAFEGLKVVQTVDPDPSLQEATREAYQRWLELLKKQIEIN